MWSLRVEFLAAMETRPWIAWGGDTGRTLRTWRRAPDPGCNRASASSSSSSSLFQAKKKTGLNT